jgi:hypothetical protein
MQDRADEEPEPKKQKMEKAAEKAEVEEVELAHPAAITFPTRNPGTFDSLELLFERGMDELDPGVYYIPRSQSDAAFDAVSLDIDPDFPNRTIVTFYQVTEQYLVAGRIDTVKKIFAGDEFKDVRWRIVIVVSAEDRFDVEIELAKELYKPEIDMYLLKLTRAEATNWVRHPRRWDEELYDQPDAEFA